MGIIAASMATLRPLLRRIRSNSVLTLPSWKFGSGSSGRRNTGNSRSFTTSIGSGGAPRNIRASQQLSTHGIDERDHNFLSVRSDSAESLNPHTHFNATPKLDPETKDKWIQMEDQSELNHDTP
jgi:hypothetical protein